MSESEAGLLPDLSDAWEELLSGGRLTLVVQVVDIAASIIIGVFLARYLGKAGLGTFSLTAGLIDMGTLASSQTVPMALTKHLAGAGSAAERRALWRTGSVFLVASSLAAWAALVAAGPALAVEWYRAPELADYFLLAGALVLFNNLRSLVEGLLQGLAEVALLNRLRLLSFAVHIACLVPLALKWGVAGALWAAGLRALSEVLFFFMLAKTPLKELGAPFGWDRAAFKTLFAYSFPAWLAALFSAPRYWLICSFITRYAGLAAVGQFSVAYSLCRNMGILSTSLALPYVPLVSRLGSKDPRALAGIVPRVQRAMAALLLPPAFLLAAFAPLALRVVFGESYVPAAPALVVLAAAFFWAGLIDNVGQVLIGLGRMWAGLAMNVLSLAWFLLGAWLWVPALGSLGAALAFVFAFALHGLASVLYARWVLGIRLDGYSAIVLGSAALFGALYLLQRRYWFGGAYVLGLVPLAAAAGAWAWKLYPREDPR